MEIYLKSFWNLTGAKFHKKYFCDKEDPTTNEVRVLRPRIGKTDQTLADYNVNNGDTVFLIPDPFPG